jgi:hypothetical protein
MSEKFAAVKTSELQWEDGSELLGLPKGVQVKILGRDKGSGRLDFLVQFPPGYVEPGHTHPSWHSDYIIEGRVIVGGVELHAGDYVFGWDEYHGPFEFPDGVTIFASTVGATIEHEWDESNQE